MSSINTDGNGAGCENRTRDHMITSHELGGVPIPYFVDSMRFYVR